MKKWIVSIPWDAVTIHRMDARTKDQAIEKAAKKVKPSFCESCSKKFQLIEPNYDGEPEALELVFEN